MINLFMLRNRLYSDYNLTDFSVTVTYFENGLQEKRFDSLNYTEWWGFLQEYGTCLVTRFTVDFRDDVKHIDIYLLAKAMNKAEIKLRQRYYSAFQVMEAVNQVCPEEWLKIAERLGEIPPNHPTT